MSPPTRRTPGGTGSRGTATSTQQADEANAHSASSHRQDQDDAPGLFAVTVQRHDGHRDVQFVLPADADPAGRRDRAVARVEATADAQDRQVIDQAIRAFTETGEPWSANDLRRVLPVVRKPLVGARVLAAAKRGEIVRVGYTPSTEPAANCRPVAVWQRAGGAP